MAQTTYNVNMNFKLVKFNIDCGRMGILDGLFIVTSDVWHVIEGLKWYANDVLGKHSELWGQIGVEGDWDAKNVSQEDLDTLARILNFDVDEIQPYDADLMEQYQARYVIAGFDIVAYIQEGQVIAENDEEDN